MRKKIVHHSIKVFKVSTWIASILTLLVVLLIAAVMAFPVLMKAPIENQLSALSNTNISISNPHLRFNFSQNNLSLRIDDLDITTVENKDPIANIDGLEWDVHLGSLLDDVYHPSKIVIDTLILHSGTGSNPVEMKQMTALRKVNQFIFFESLSIRKTVIEGEKKLDIAPILLTHNHLKITGQNLSFNSSDTQPIKVNIDITLPTDTPKNSSLIVPILISNNALSINTEIKLFNKKGDDWLEIKSDLAKIPANRLTQYLPTKIMNDKTYAWIKQGFIAGSLENLKLRISKNLSQSSTIDTQFNAQLKNIELKFHPDWNPLKKLNANFSMSGKNIRVNVHNAQLNEFPLNDIKVQITDFSQANVKVEVSDDIHTQSEQLIAFLKRSPLSKEVYETLHQFTLSGKVDSTVQLVIPLDKSAPILDIDLYLENNRLSVLDEAVVVKNYHSKVTFRNNKIKAAGVGDIRGLPFDIRINPHNKGDNNEHTLGVELININSGFTAYITKQLDQSWHGRIESESIKGDIAVFLKENELPTVQLSDVQITTLKAIKGDWKITPTDLPSMHLSTQKMYVDKNILPNFSVELISADNQLTIKDLQFEGIDLDDKALSFNGIWANGKTQLHANVKGKALTEFLKKLKVKEKVTGGAFDFDIHLACECAPWNMNYQNITGILKLNVKKGVFTDKDPNLGRVLSLLNINSIAKLDISDVAEKGFAYDSIDAQIDLNNAIATISNFTLESSSSQIILTGKTNIKEKKYDLMAQVIPALSDAVPVASYLTGGGLAGLGAWLIDKVLFNGKIIGSITDSLVEFRYKITGSWEKPQIKEL